MEALIVIVAIVASTAAFSAVLLSRSERTSVASPERKSTQQSTQRPAAQSTQKPLIQPSNAKENKMITVTDSVRLEVSKALRQLKFADANYGLGVWADNANYDNWLHDLEWMRAARDLKSVTLQLLAHDGSIYTEFAIAFQAAGARPDHKATDSGGIELPVLERKRISGARVIVSNVPQADQSYRAHLRMNWSTAADLQKQKGDAFASDHAAKITGGRQTGAFHVASDARHRLVITNGSPTSPYAFARDLNLNHDGIFILRKHAPGVPLEPGVQVTGIVIQTPRGLQCRQVRCT